MPGFQFREAIGPPIGDAVRRRRVDDARAVIVDQRHRLARRIVGQAEDDDVRSIERVPARAGILAVLFVQRDQRQFGAAGQPVADFDPRGAMAAIDEDAGGHAPILRRAMMGLG